MGKKYRWAIIHRWEGNPVITIEDVPFRCADIWNAGAIKHGNNYLLLLTVQELKGEKAIYIAKSTDGYYFDVDDKPFITPDKNHRSYKYEAMGVIDPRITKIDDDYFISYVAESRHGERVGLLKTKDFLSFERLGLVSEPDTDGGALFPEKINGNYAMLFRPNHGARIWITYSDDMIYWGNSEVVLSPRNGFWDFHKVGPAIPPLRVPDGRWLLIYYGKKYTSAGHLIRLGAAFLDADNPAIVVARTNIPILSPRTLYERIGDVPNIVFSCGAILENDTLKIYYGGAASCICLGTISLNTIIENCIASEKDF